MNVFEENELLRQEVLALRADLAGAETRLQDLQVRHHPELELGDDETKRISLGRAFAYPKRRKSVWR
jgi:hypothetical protein